MRVLQFAPRVCWPLDTGAKLRNFHLARVLSKATTVTLLAFKENGESPQLANIYERIVTVPRRGSYSFPKVLRGAIGRTPLPILNYTTDEMREAAHRLVSESDFDLVQIESIHLMNYLPKLRAGAGR